MGSLVGEEQGLKKGGGRAPLVWKAATCRHGGPSVAEGYEGRSRTAGLQGRRPRDPGGLADVAASGRLLGAECEVRFPSFEDGTLGIPPGSFGRVVGMKMENKSVPRTDTDSLPFSCAREDKEPENQCEARCPGVPPSPEGLPAFACRSYGG